MRRLKPTCRICMNAYRLKKRYENIEVKRKFENEYATNNYKKDPEKNRARARFRYLVKSGKVKKEGCQEIGELCDGRIEAHHYKGYKNEHWKDIWWLCMFHHKIIHYPRIVPKIII